MTIPQSEWKWYGNAGHFICSHDCRFHLCTLIGDYLISTVGQYLPGEGTREILALVRKITLKGRGDAREADYLEKVGYEDIGYKRKFETMVFKVSGETCTDPECDCGMPTIIPSELETDAYNRAGNAALGHLEMCLKWAEGRGDGQNTSREG